MFLLSFAATQDNILIITEKCVTAVFINNSGDLDYLQVKIAAATKKQSMKL